VFDGQADPAARIPSQDRWSYQWLAADSREAADEEFAAIEGETCPSLTITKELATKLAGKYIRVRVEGDGQTLYGPSGSFDTPASIGYNTPGPVIAPDQIKLDYILLSWNGEGFGSSELESVPSCNVEDVLEARAYDFDDPHTLYGASDVDFSWQVSDSQDGPFKEITQGASFKVPKDCTGCYLKVVAKAKNGVPGSSTCETKPGKVLPKGVTTLYWVSILNASSSKEIGGTLQAQAYKSTHWGDAPINTNVEYTWRWSAEKPKSSDFDDNSWHIIEGETGSTFTVPESLEGCWVSVAACTGDNTVVSANASAAGPFRKPGTHELYYAALDQMPADSNFTFWSGRTIGVAARNTTNAGTAGSYLSPDELTYTWYSADSWDGEYVELADENVHKPSFVIPDSYVGKHLKCLVSAGFNTMEAGPMRKPIAQGEAIEPADPVPPEPAKPVSATISARVTGLLPHATGEPLQAVNWVSPQKYAVKDSAKTSAWDVFADLLDKAGYFYSLDGGCPYSITTPDRSQTLAMSAGAPWSYWAFLINGEYADVMASSYHPQDGDVLELVYVDATGPATTPDIVVNPDEPGAEWEADWGSFGAAAGEPAVVGSTLGSLPARWTYDFAQGDYASWSEPVVAGGYVFCATGSRLLKLDASTGAVVEVVPLADGTAYGCRPVYTKGLIVVPLNNGRLQALSALTLQTRWLTEALPAAVQEVASGSGGGAAAVAYDQQGLSTLTVSGDYLYAFTAAADWSQTYEGWALCVNASTGAIRWMQKNTDAGYYWSGAASVGDYLVVAGEDGVRGAVSAASTDGEPAATLALGAPVRSTVVTVDGFAYVVTTNGTLHKVSVGANGALTQVGAVSFGDYSTSTPALADGVLYVGGSQNGQGLLGGPPAPLCALTASRARRRRKPAAWRGEEHPASGARQCGCGGAVHLQRRGRLVARLHLRRRRVRLSTGRPGGTARLRSPGRDAQLRHGLGGLRRRGHFLLCERLGPSVRLGPLLAAASTAAEHRLRDAGRAAEPGNAPEAGESYRPGQEQSQESDFPERGHNVPRDVRKREDANGRRGKRRAAERRRCGPNPLRHHCAAGLLQHQGGGSWHRRRRRWGCPRQNRRSGSGQPHAAGEGERREH